MQGDWLLIKDFAPGDFLLRGLCYFHEDSKINLKSEGIVHTISLA
jgi:hypothetical protein